MKQYKVLVTNEALVDMEQIYNYIASVFLSPEIALKQYNHISEKILTLSTFPERFQVINSTNEYLKGLRRMLVDNYSVFYLIKDDSVVVTNVLYSASNIQEKFNIF